MLENYLPQIIWKALKKYYTSVSLNEIRLRVNRPIIIVFNNKKYYLGENGFSSRDKAIICDNTMLQTFVYKLCENSVYTVNDFLKCGFITLPQGVRVGICGEVVYENDKVLTIKNFQSVNIRIPHIVEDCASIVFDFIVKENMYNTLIISPPGAGKTTFIRDIVMQLNKRDYPFNVLIADERNEIACLREGESDIQLGDFADIYTNCSKEYAFKYGIRSMRPDIIVTDEIDIDRDMQTILDAICSGVKVVATIHADGMEQLKLKRGFDYVLNNKLFDRFVVLSNQNGPGTLKAIYNEKLQCIYCG